MRRPNFFIVGAPKCGTTSMYHYLMMHPDIFMPPIDKEPKFFGSDLPFQKNWFQNKISNYIKIFSEAKKEKMIGEASTTYFFSQNAAKEIKEFEPNAKIIIMLRNPVDMMCSLYSQLVFMGLEEETSFTEALKKEPVRKKKSLQEKIQKVLLYKNIASYYKHVKRFYQLFGNKNIHIIKFEDFVKNTPVVYRKTLEFLEVDPNFKVNFGKINSKRVTNPNKIHRSQKIQNFLYQPPKFVSTFYKKFIPKKIRYFVFTLVLRINTNYQPRTKISDRTRKKLTAELAPNIRSLSKLTKLHLSNWYK